MMKHQVKYASKDFNGSDLPNRRRQQFWDIIRIRWRTLFGLAAILLASSIPLFIVIFFKDARATSIASTVSGNEQVAQLFINNMFFGIFYVPGTVLIFLALSGIMRIYRNIIWGEAVFFRQDFFLGIKQNGLIYSLIAVIFSVTYFLCQIAIFYISVVAVSYLPLVIFVALIVPTLAIILCLTPIYKNGFWRNVKNAYLLYFTRLPLYFVFYLLLIFPFVIMLLSALPFLAKYIIYFFTFVLILPLTLLAWDLFNVSTFDKYVNQTRHPELYRKGLNRLD